MITKEQKRRRPMKHTLKKTNRMKRHMLVLPVFLVVVVALIMVSAAPNCWAGGWDDFEVGELYFELNDTDGDLGIHGKIDGGPWKNIWIKDPYYNSIMKVTTRGRLRQQALTELFFESAEPSFDDLDPDEFFDRFPEGYYRIYGWSEDGKLLKGKSRIRHVMPAPPDGISLNDGDTIDLEDVDCDDEETIPEVSGPTVTISWEEVDSSHPEIGDSGTITPALYEVVVEVELEDEFVSVFSVVLPPDQTSMTVPEEFIALGTEFKYEILVKEARGGNQTAMESCFVIEEENGE
jgi:hypothetical protein